MTTAELQEYISNLDLTENELIQLMQSLAELKTYNFQRTTQRGSTQNCCCTVDSLVGSFTDFNIIVAFENYESFEEKEMKSKPADRPLVLRLNNGEFWKELLKGVFEDDKDKSILVILSNIIWRLAFEKEFIEDWSTIENGVRVKQLKSLTQLEAVEV